MSKTEAYRIPSHGNDQRLDRILQTLTSLSRKKVKGILDQGRVLLNGRRVVIASWQVRPGDRVEIVSEGDEAQPGAGEHYLKIVHEDADLLVIEKDAGIACEKSPVAIRPSIVSIINAYLKRKYPHRKGHYLGLVHRLDRDTSGLMVYTKTHEANRITDQFKRHAIKRRYLAVVAGRVENPSGRIEGYLKKSNLLSGGRKVASSTPETGRQAVTLFKVVERYDNATLVEVTLNTGRTHQIRVQMASIGHPVVGDQIYGRGGSRTAPTTHFPRQALHASFLQFHHPITGKKMEFRSELPRDMRRLVDRLRIRA